MKVTEGTLQEQQTLIEAKDIPLGRFAKTPGYEHTTYLRVFGASVVRFQDGAAPEVYPVDTYDTQRFEVLPESFQLTIGGK